MCMCGLQNCISVDINWLKPSHTNRDNRVDNSTIERITLFASLVLAMLTVASNLTSLERRLTLLESQKINASEIEGRLARIETLLERHE